jgi:hypothetical protein
MEDSVEFSCCGQARGGVEGSLFQLDDVGRGPSGAQQCIRLLTDVLLRCYLCVRYRCKVPAMSPFSVTIEDVPDRELGPLLTQLSRAGFDTPIITPAGTTGASAKAAAPARRGAADLPGDWRLVRERCDDSYRWPKRRDRYAPYRVFVGTTRTEGAVQVGLGETTRKNAWGRDRKYVVAFLSSGSPQKPLAEFLAADDYKDTRELVAVIRGSDGGRRMYGPGDALPEIYEDRFRTQMYDDRVDHAGVWHKVVVVAHEDDHATMLNHALIQGRRRGST